LNKESQYQNYQKLNLQESPSNVQAGRVPRSKEIVVLGDLIDTVRPGEEVDITGIYLLSGGIPSKGRRKEEKIPIFSTFILANHIKRKNMGLSTDDETSPLSRKEEEEEANIDSEDEISETEKAMIMALSRDPRIFDRLMISVCPSIYGLYDIKRSLLVSLFGGVSKMGDGGHKIRGDINVLLVGDPGTGKSQILKYVQNISHRCIFTTGKGASAVGLTASVKKDTMSGEMVLEGGALVLSDGGTCIIDEFDKVSLLFYLKKEKTR